MVLLDGIGNPIVKHVDKSILLQSFELLVATLKVGGPQMTNNETIAINGPLTGEIEVPGDKSMTHRAIMLASLATGKSTINKPLLGEDCLRTVEIFKN